MKAEILSVGTELLLGDILNTNAQYLARQLAALGISVYYQTVVGDNQERLRSAYEQAFGRADLVVASGGLGPTDDDLTKEIGAAYFDKKMILHQDIYDNLKASFLKRGMVFTENNRKQAEFPEGCTILSNPNGTAPGCMIEENGKILVLMPGPPSEMIPMFENEVVPRLKTKEKGILVSRTLRICGIGESLLEIQLKDLIDAQKNPTIAPYAKVSEVHLRVTAGAESEDAAVRLLDPVIKEIYDRLGQNIYGEDSTTLEQSVVDLLKARNLSLAVAESCTGGALTGTLVNVSSVSEILLEGLVTYSNTAKMNRLNVKEETLKKYGAVSPQTAQEMAAGAMAVSGARVGIATTGIAGPNGGTEEKPVGLVYIGYCDSHRCFAREYNFSGNRQKIRDRAVVSALDLLRRQLLDMENGGE